MKKQTTSNRQKQLLFAAIACIMLFLTGQTQVAARNQPTPPPNRQVTPDGAVGGNKINAECSYEPPGPPVTEKSKFSEAVAKRKTYDAYAVNANGTGSAPLKVGVVFLYFKMGAPYKNTVANVPGYGAKRRHDGAPAGATIYTLKTKIMVCEQYRNAVQRRLVEGSRACFKDKDGSWTCPSENDTKITQLDQD